MAKPPPEARRVIHALDEASPRRPAKLLHWTVLPLGPVGGIGCGSDSLLAAIDGIDAAPFTLVFDRVACRAGGTAALTVTRLPAAVRKLRAALGDALMRAGATPVHKPSRPHVTLDYGWPGRNAVRPVDPVVWEIDRVVLVESVTGEARHVHLGEGRLVPRQGSLFPLLPCL